MYLNENSGLPVLLDETAIRCSPASEDGSRIVLGNNRLLLLVFRFFDILLKVFMQVA